MAQYHIITTTVDGGPTILKSFDGGVDLNRRAYALAIHWAEKFSKENNNMDYSIVRGPAAEKAQDTVGVSPSSLFRSDDK